MVRHAMALARVLVSAELLTRSRMTRDLRIGIAVPTWEPLSPHTTVLELRNLYPMRIECL